MKKIAFALVLSFCAAVSSFAYSSDDVNLKMVRLSENLNAILPNAATEQNVYAPAWIGKLLPSAPPHFAVGAEAGVTKFDLSPLKETADIFGVAGLPSLLVFPTITANARVGGLFLPFDVGFSAMYLNLNRIDSIADGLGIQFFDIGGDIRYAILRGDGFLPQISLGFGYYYIDGKISYAKDGLYAKFDYACHTMFAQAQVSKTFLFFTPYVGFRGIVSKSQADWSWVADAARVAGAPQYVDLVFGGNGSSSANFFGQFLPQVYGGFGLNLGFLALNFGAAYEFCNKIWGGNFSVRFQM